MQTFERVVDRHLPELVRGRNVKGLRRVLEPSLSPCRRQGNFEARRIFLDHSHAPQHIEHKIKKLQGTAPLRITLVEARLDGIVSCRNSEKPLRNLFKTLSGVVSIILAMLY